MTAAITVLAIRKLDGKSTVKAFVDLQLGGVKIMGAKIIQQEGQKAWLGMPAVKGNHGWTNTVELSKHLREKVTEVVLAAWATHQPPPPQALGSKADLDAYVQTLADRFKPDDDIGI
jgi:DNA-binding cell septation regulator SpoVG